MCRFLAVWAFHTGLDWDWEMPAVTLLAIVIAGALIAQSEQPAPSGAPRLTAVRERDDRDRGQHHDARLAAARKRVIP